MQRSFRLRRAAAHGVAGFVFGFLVLHPVAMAVFAWFSGRDSGELLEVVGRRVLHSFLPDMVPMGLVFGLFSLVVGALDGFYRSLVQLQRDDLGQQLTVNREYRRELEVQYETLRELELEKRRLTQFLVHDLKNHLGCVLGYTDLLVKRGHAARWGSTERLALETIQRQASRMDGAVRDVLGLAKLEHCPAISAASVRVEQLLREGISAAALGPDDRGVHIGGIAPPDIMATCDESLIVRVLANLVLNAIRHNPVGVEVTVSGLENGRQVVIACADSGGGIPSAVRGRLFEEFTSAARNGQSQAVPSYGLGLAFCRTVVHAHGGRIWFETSEGRGTTFFVALPTASEEGGGS